MSRKATTYKRMPVRHTESGGRVAVERLEAVRFHTFGYESDCDSDGNIINSVAIVEDQFGGVATCEASLIRFLDAGHVDSEIDPLNHIADVLAGHLNWFMITRARSSETGEATVDVLLPADTSEPHMAFYRELIPTASFARGWGGK